MKEIDKINKIQIILSVIMLLLTSAAYAQESMYLKVFFREGESRIDRAYMNNGPALDSFVKTILDMQNNSTEGIDYIIIETGCSPEGNYDSNEKLAMDRNHSIRSYIVNKLPLNASQVRSYSRGVDWEGFYNIIYSIECPYKEELSRILSKYNLKTNLSKEDSDACLKAIKTLDEGKAWQWIRSNNVLENLRQSTGKVTCVFNGSSEHMYKKDTVVIIHEYRSREDNTYDSLKVFVNNQVEAKMPYNNIHKYKKDNLMKEPIIAIRTNFLLPLLNVGIELPFNNRISMAADLYYPWMKREWMNGITSTNNQYCIQGLGGYAECRIWLGAMHNKNANKKYRLCGHSVALVLAGGYYDYSFPYHGTEGWNGTSEIPLARGRQGEVLAAGADYAYYLPVGERNGLRLSFNITIGYMMTFYIPYGVYDDDGTCIIEGTTSKKEMLTWIGPIRAGFNLVIPIYTK